MKTDYTNSDALWMTYPRGLKYLALTGIILGVSEMWFAVSYIWLHWPGSAFFLFFATIFFIFLSLMMIFTGNKSVAAILMWLGMGDMALAQLFMTLLWPGGALVCAYGGFCIIAIIAAIWHHHTLPNQYAWSKNVLMWWVIGIQLVFFILFWVKWYYLQYMVDQFEPAIPYADHSVYYLQNRVWSRKYIVFGNGLAQFIFSLPLYIVARKQSKK